MDDYQPDMHQFPEPDHNDDDGPHVLLGLVIFALVGMLVGFVLGALLV